MPIIGASLKFRVGPLLDDTGAALTGATWSLVEALKPDDSAFTVTYSENGAGVYTAITNAVSDQAGIWTLFSQTTVGGIVYSDFSQEEVISGSASTIPGVTAVNAGLSVSLSELRRRVARRLGDSSRNLVATSNGTTTTFIDSLNVSSASENRNGNFLYFLSGTAGNIGKVVRVTTTTDASNTLTFVPAVPSNTAIGDVVQATNFRGVGFDPDMIKDAINDAINDAFPLGLIKVTADVVGYSADPPSTITVPANMYYVSDLSFVDGDGVVRPLVQASRTNAFGWRANSATGEIVLVGRPGWWADGLTLRLIGWARQATLSADTDTCVLNAEYIVSRACYHLALSKISSDQMYGQMVGVFQRESEMLRSRVRTMREAGSMPVRSI